MSECKLCSCRRGESTLASRTYRVRTRRMLPINWCMGHWLTSRFKKNDWHYSIRHLFLVEIHQGGPKYHISTFNIEYAFSINYHFPIHSAYIIIPFLCHLWYRYSNPLAYCVPIAIWNCGNTVSTYQHKTYRAIRRSWTCTSDNFSSRLAPSGSVASLA